MEKLSERLEWVGVEAKPLGGKVRRYAGSKGEAGRAVYVCLCWR